MWGLSCGCYSSVAWFYQEWDVELVTSLRPRRCYECYELIAPGEVHKQVTAVGGSDCPEVPYRAAYVSYDDEEDDELWSWQDTLEYTELFHFCLPCERIRDDFCCDEVPLGELVEAIWECTGLNYVTGEIDEDEDEAEQEREWIEFSREEMAAR